jgi:hypothetical protein
VPDFAAHMFIFYYAVLSEVSPPTALSPFAAAAITGGDPYDDAAVVEIHAAGVRRAVRVRARSGGVACCSRRRRRFVSGGDLDCVHRVHRYRCACLRVQKWMLRQCNAFERWTLIVCGILLVYPAPAADAIGLAGSSRSGSFSGSGGDRRSLNWRG